MAEHLNDQIPLTNAIKAMVSCYVDGSGVRSGSS